MIRILIHRKFEKKIIRLSKKIKVILKNRLSIFADNPFDSRLSNHSLHGIYRNYRSINITGDIRLIYEEIDANTVILLDIDSHSNLYR